MSLTSVYCKGTDNKYYKDPLICGTDWFICTDDNDPVELVMTIDLFNRTRPATFLANLGIRAEVVSKKPNRAQRLFPPAWTEFKESVSFFIEFEGHKFPVLPEFPISHKGVYDSLDDIKKPEK